MKTTPGVVNHPDFTAWRRVVNEALSPWRAFHVAQPIHAGVSAQLPYVGELKSGIRR